jgi:hypothetical protein
MRHLALVALLGACGSDPPAGGTDAHATDAAYDTAKCLIAGIYGDLGAKTGTTSQGPTTMTITLDPGPPKDSFFLKLVAGKGAFAGGLANGTFTIAGADASFNNCGLCTNIIADINPTTGPAKFYFADSGTVTLTSTSPPGGSLQNVHLFEVDIATGAAVAGGCIATITAMTFSGT